MKKMTRGQIIAVGTLFILCGVLILSSQYLLDKKNSLFELINMQLYFNQIDDISDVPDVPENPVTPEQPEEKKNWNTRRKEN